MVLLFGQSVVVFVVFMLLLLLLPDGYLEKKIKFDFLTVFKNLNKNSLNYFLPLQKKYEKFICLHSQKKLTSKKNLNEKNVNKEIFSCKSFHLTFSFKKHYKSIDKRKDIIPLYMNMITALFKLTPCGKAGIRLRHFALSICLYFIDIIIV